MAMHYFQFTTIFHHSLILTGSSEPHTPAGDDHDSGAGSSPLPRSALDDDNSPESERLQDVGNIPGLINSHKAEIARRMDLLSKFQTLILLHYYSCR